jgi:hypothetical protein
VDARGAAGADHGTPAPSTASWLRGRLRLGAGAATSCVRTARALFGGPLTRTAEALCAGELSAAHAAVLAHGTRELPDQVAAEAEPVLVAAARRLDPLRLRRLLGHLQAGHRPGGPSGRPSGATGGPGVVAGPELGGMVALQGLLEAEAGQTLLAALDPWPAPVTLRTPQRGPAPGCCPGRAGRRTLEGGQLPQSGGSRPQLAVVVDLDSLLGGPGAVGGELGWVGSLAPGGVSAAGL